MAVMKTQSEVEYRVSDPQHRHVQIFLLPGISVRLKSNGYEVTNEKKNSFFTGRTGQKERQSWHHKPTKHNHFKTSATWKTLTTSRQTMTTQPATSTRTKATKTTRTMRVTAKATQTVTQLAVMERTPMRTTTRTTEPMMTTPTLTRHLHRRLPVL
jgi:hypothetical protein